MEIEVKGCRMCPFIIITSEEGERYYDCSRGTFYNYKNKEVSKTEIHLECPLRKENITVRLSEGT